MTDRKAVIKNADMSEEMQQDAVDCATQAMEKYNIEKDIAAFIKREFDKKYNPTWHCIVGRNFGSYVTHETKVFRGNLALYLLLLGSNRYSFVQVWLIKFSLQILDTSIFFSLLWGICINYSCPLSLFYYYTYKMDIEMMKK
jgi:dynein light chain LC8-type